MTNPVSATNVTASARSLRLKACNTFEYRFCNRLVHQSGRCVSRARMLCAGRVQFDVESGWFVELDDFLPKFSALRRHRTQKYVRKGNPTKPCTWWTLKFVWQRSEGAIKGKYTMPLEIAFRRFPSKSFLKHWHRYYGFGNCHLFISAFFSSYSTFLVKFFVLKEPWVIFVVVSSPLRYMYSNWRCCLVVITLDLLAFLRPRRFPQFLTLLSPSFEMDIIVFENMFVLILLRFCLQRWPNLTWTACKQM